LKKFAVGWKSTALENTTTRPWLTIGADLHQVHPHEADVDDVPGDTGDLHASRTRTPYFPIRKKYATTERITFSAAQSRAPR